MPKAADFSLKNQDGKEVKLSDFLGKYVVLYFYPKDNTPGCTVQGCLFRDYHREIIDKNAVILGISADDASSHRDFKSKYSFPFDLLSDADHKVSELYGAWGTKSFFGKKFEGIKRMTYLINPKGEVVKVWEKANPKTNAKDVLDELMKLEQS